MEAKRICLFAGYNAGDEIDDDVLFYLQALTELADVYYFADGVLSAKQNVKLEKVTVKAWGEKHGKYDFGSWAELIKRLGWEKICSYDELLLANDSCFGGVFPLIEMFKEMDGRQLDAWGASGNHFIMSYFVCLTKKVFSTPDFCYFFENIKVENHKSIIIKKYERGLDHLLQNYKTDVYLSKPSLNAFYRQQQKAIKNKIAEVVPWYGRWLFKLNSKKVNLYDENAVLPLLMKFPFVKKNAFKNKCSFFAVYGEELIARNSNYPIEFISHFRQMIGQDKLTGGNILKNRVQLWKERFIYEEKYKKNVKIIKIFKIPIFRKKMDYTI